MRILVTGSRDWDDWNAIDEALYQAWNDIGGPRETTLVHGGCPTGVDAMAALIWGYRTSQPVECHPADWERRGKAAGPIRNQEMVDLGADICLAFPLGESRGTRDCMRRAEAAGIPVVNFGDPS